MSIRSIDWRSIRWVAGFLAPHRAMLIGVVSLAIVQTAVALPTLALVRQVLDEVLPSRRAEALPWIAAAIVGLRVVGSLLALAVRSLVLRISKSVASTLRDHVVSHVATRCSLFFANADLTQLQTRIVHDSERVDGSLTAVVAGVLPALLSSAMLLIVMGYISVGLTAIGVASMPVLWMVGRRTTRRVEADLRAFRTSFEDVSAGTHFLLRFSELIRLRGMTELELRVQSVRHERLRLHGIRMGHSFSLHANIQRIVTGLLGISLLIVGSLQVMRGRLTLGDFLVFYVASTMLSGYLETLGGAVTEVVSGGAAAAALRQVIAEGSGEPYAGRETPLNIGSLELRQVSFRYPDKPLLLDELSLTVAPGERLLVLGENGAGKSTLAKLLLGTVRPDVGRVLLDGIPYDALDISYVRRQIGLVPQHPQYFRGSVFENLVYGCGEVANSDIERALEISRFGDVIKRLPNGLHTTIGDRGATLSGGEAQRLSIARTILQNSAFIIFDEPTTHLDAESVKHLLEGLRGWGNGPGMLLISHDPAILTFSERAYRLTHGRLEQEYHASAASH